MGLRILPVEDSKTTRSIQKNVLDQLGHTKVMEANDGAEVLARIVETVKAGVNNRAVKPFTAQTLAEKINATLAKTATASTG